jgi:hypothetical protein
MAVQTTLVNKPLNPRGNDQSPLAYNRAKLFSGKALDFDGVNDYVDLDGFTLSGTTATFSFAFNSDDLSVLRYFFDASDTRFIIGSGNTANYLTLYTPTSSFQDIAEVQTGEWYKLDISINGTSAVCYLNGVLVNTLTIGAIDLSAATLAKFGSARNGAGLFYNGQASNFKIFNTALTAAQVADLYNNPEKVVPTGVDNTALKLWLPMQEGAGTTALNGAPDAIGSELVTNGDFATDSDWEKSSFWTISGGTASMPSTSSYVPLYQNNVTTAGNTYVLNFDIISITGIIKATSINNGAASGEITLGEYSTTGNKKIIFTADSGREAIAFARVVNNASSCTIDNVSVKQIQNVGTISGATWTHGIGAPVAQTSVIDWNKISDGTNEVLIPQGLTSGRDLLGNLFENVRKQGALNLDGNSRAEVHDNESLDITDAITLEAWVYWDGTSSDDGILGRWGDLSADRCYMLYGDPNKVYFYISSTPIFHEGMATGWRHIVGTYDKINTKLYIDGQQEASSTAISIDIPTSSKNLEIGTYRYGGSRNYKHPLAQPRIYNRALTAEEVQRNYNAGKNIYTN